ncbi:MAG: ATP-binding cassette domain-containing protein [Mycoplasmatales bacterium]|nr:ATP-binding cassette domain-containing protein [Mycoplasmatales bacterium]
MNKEIIYFDEGVLKINKKNLLSFDSFFLKKNQITLLIGKNGVGKTVFSEYIMDNIFKKSITSFGVVSDQVNYYQNEKLINKIRILNKFKSMPLSDNQIKEMLQKWKLENVLNKKIENLSGGQKQAFKLLILFIADPEIIVLDEPERFLSEEVLAHFINEIKKMRDKFILIISHDKKVISLADRTLTIENKILKENL